MVGALFLFLTLWQLLVDVRAFRSSSVLRSMKIMPVKKLLSTSPLVDIDLTGMELSTLQGKALKAKEYPTLGEVKSILPTDSYKKDTKLSLSFAGLDLLTTGTTAFLGIKYLLPIANTLFHSANPLNQLFGSIMWLFYSAVVGTCGISMWVTAHECGHGAFSDNKFLQDFVGYLYHSFWLVPYFSWQRSHAVHHANTNNVEDGETHVPPVKVNPSSHVSSKVLTQKLFGKRLGEGIYGTIQILAHFIIGWPGYLLFGATGGPSRGMTNHFIPVQFNRFSQQRASPLRELFPGAWKKKVYLSDIGVAAMVMGLIYFAKKFGWGWVLAAYGGPYLVVNAWLVAYTWLQHTEVDVPHFPAQGFTFMKGAFQTIDRPYPKLLWGVIDFMHHHIGSTHVVHHIDSTIPHYRAKKATEVLQQQYPDQYLYESTPVFAALWRIATKCYAAEKRPTINNPKSDQDFYVYVDTP